MVHKTTGARSAEQILSSGLFEAAQAAVRGFGVSAGIDAAAATAFGVSGTTVAAAIADLDESGWPRLVLVDDDVLNGARAAYDASRDTIYLSRTFLLQATPAAVTAVLIEEIGHAVDPRVNATDAPGDEGAIFAQLVLGNTVGGDELAELKAENDHGTVAVGGTTNAVEFAGEVLGSITLNGNLSDWTAADQIDGTLSMSGYDIYAKFAGGSYVFALQAPVAIGATTTVWLNTDRNLGTGYQIWGFAGGAEYNINFDAAGTPRLYTGADGQTLVSGANVAFGYSSDRTIVEFAVAAAAIGSPTAINTLWDINNNTFLPTDYSATQYTVSSAPPAPPPAVVVGSITLNGNLSDWTAADQIDQTLSVSGYDIYARLTGSSYVFALKAPIAIGDNTTVWLNTDRNAGTGYQIWDFAGGAEYNINFDASGVPRLYTGADGQTLVAGATVSYAFSADRTAVEFALPTSAVGSPGAINTLWDINDNTYLPTDYSATQFTVGAAATPASVVGSITLDGSLADWTAADQVDKSLSASGYDLYAKTSGGSYVFAIKAPVAIAANTTVWLNTDQNAATGHQIWGFAGGAEYNINFDAAGVPRLYTGADGQTLVSGATVSFGFSADRTVVEFAVPTGAIGSPTVMNTLWDVNDSTYLPTDYSLTQYVVGSPIVSAPRVGSVTLDGNLGDWTAAEAIDQTFTVGGYDIYAKAAGDSYVFAIRSPVAIESNTTAWLNTDQNAGTGYQIWGFAGGAEYHVNFDAAGIPRLYTGADGQTLVPGVNLLHGFSADRTVVEFAVPTSAIGSPRAINTLWDVNDNTYLPSDYSATQYSVVGPVALPQKIGIVYSETTANQFFSKMAYSQLFMAAQSQATMAGVTFDVLTESDLTNLSKLATYDALLFPGFANVQSSQVAAIENTLKLLVQQHGTGLIAAGNFMTSDQTGAALPGDPYARMKTLLDVQPVDAGFPANVTVNAADVSHPMMNDYGAGELIRSYSGVGWQAFAPVTTPGTNVLATQTIGTETFNSVISTTTGGRNVHFSTAEVMADNNLLWQAIDFAVNGSGVTAGLQLSRNSSIVASRVDMDQAFVPAAVNPADGSPGIYDRLIPIVEQWKSQYGYVGSYYVDIGDAPPARATEWQISAPYYMQLLAMGNEIGSHSISHPFDTNTLTAAQIQYEFQQSKQMIEQQMSQILGRPFTVDGAAVPGQPENFQTAMSILQYYKYLSGGFAGVGAGYPNGFGYLDPTMAGLDKLYIAPNLKFDFTLVEFEKLTVEQAAAEWAREVADLSRHADVPILLWPWHDYASTEWLAVPYTTELFTDFISRAHASGSEFVTLADLAQRMSVFEDSSVTTSVSGSTITATVTSPGAGKLALDLDNLGTQKIARVTNWFAYDDDSVFLPRNAGTFTIQLGAAADDVTRIVTLPMRAELVSLTGNGTTLSFSLVGEGSFVVDLKNPAGQQYEVTGARVVGLNGERVTLALDSIALHDVSVALSSANRAPVIFSNGAGAAAPISVAENAAAVTTVLGGDPNVGQTVTYAITGGADAARFAISAQGALTFRAAPDFEAPGDAGANNVYDVVVTVRDSAGLTDSQTLAVSVTNVAGLTLTGDAAANTLTGTGEEDTLSGLGGNDTLLGLAGNDVLTGGDGDDALNGGPGVDRMTGGLGNDVYVVDNSADAVIESAGAGMDFVQSSITHTLAPNVENLTLAGTAAINASGNGEVNVITGNAASNTLSGGIGNDIMDGAGGNDVMIGGAGADRLTGSAGSDRFDYNAVTEGLDTIVDFTRGSGGDVLDIHDVLVGFGAGSNVNNFVRLSGGAATTVSVNADGVGTDFVALTTLTNVALTGTLLNELIANGNLVL